MTKTILLLGFGLVMTACATDDNGSAGDGNDTLPKRGERATDPTIVSVTAACIESCGSEVCLPETPKAPYVYVRVSASDPGGTANLGTCAATLGTVTDQDTYSSSGTSCTLIFGGVCPTSPIVVGLTVSNDTGGVTTASVKLTATKQ